MWEILLVLGRVPGTNFQITFYEFVIVCLAGLGLLWLRKKQFDYKDTVRRLLGFRISRYLVRYRKLYLLTKKGTQLKLPV